MVLHLKYNPNLASTSEKNALGCVEPEGGALRCGEVGVKLLLSLALSVTLNDANEKQKSMINSGFSGRRNGEPTCVGQRHWGQSVCGHVGSWTERGDEPDGAWGRGRNENAIILRSG